MRNIQKQEHHYFVRAGLLAVVSLLGNALPGIAQQPAAARPDYPAGVVENGRSVFQRDCAFCHGRDAAGGESGPDLTRSTLVTQDVAGSTIAPLVRSGRPDRGMPAFNLGEAEMSGVVAYIHTQKYRAESPNGQRRGVSPADLQTGNAEEGKRYFEGAGTCHTCHSATGDLAGIATRLRGLQLEQRMLYPRNARSKITVTPPGGTPVTGTLAYQDEFTVALKDADGKYQSWFTKNVKYSISAPAEAHVELMNKYTDADVHNLMAYLQTLR